MPIQPIPVVRTEEQQVSEGKFLRAGHKPENPYCDHHDWNLNSHGRHCPSCGTCMMDFGD